MIREKIIKTLNSQHFLFFVAGVVLLGVIASFFLQIRLLKTQGDIAGFGRHNYTLANTHTIQGWMTMSYLAKVYHIPPTYLQEKLNIPSNKYSRLSVAGYAKAEYMTTAQAIQKIQGVISQFQNSVLPTTN